LRTRRFDRVEAPKSNCGELWQFYSGYSYWLLLAVMHRMQHRINYYRFISTETPLNIPQVLAHGMLLVIEVMRGGVVGSVAGAPGAGDEVFLTAHEAGIQAQRGSQDNVQTIGKGIEYNLQIFIN